MERPRFSSTLLQRRRELGLSTAQASRVLKLKEQVLIALEEGDFESIPKSGYAQGMVSSYARYLGLDAREMVDMFTEDLADYEAAQCRQTRGQKQSRSSQYMRLGSPRPAVDDSRRNLLPTSGGRAGDMGDFATTSVAMTRSSSVPLVSAERMRASYDVNGTYTGGTYAGGTYSSGSYSGASLGSYGYDAYAQGDYEDDFRAPRATTTQNLRSSGLSGQNGYYSSRNLGSGYAGYEDAYFDGTATAFDDGYPEESPRSSSRTQAKRRGASSSRSGKSSARGKGSRARTSGSNARRGMNNASRNRSGRQNDAGFEGLVSFVSESRVVIGIAALVVAVIFVVAIIMGVKSCTKSRTDDTMQGVPVTTTISSTSTGTIGEESSQTSSEGQESQVQGQTTDPSATSDPSQTGASQETPVSEPGASGEAENASGQGSSEGSGQMISTEVSVSVASGETTWLEVMVDGESRIADTVVGPWNDTYVVKESLTVQADNTAAVSVFENGEVRNFETRASGVGNITIKVPVSAVDATDDAAEPTADVPAQ